jgi:hypothetical protein
MAHVQRTPALLNDPNPTVLTRLLMTNAYVDILQTAVPART